MTRNNRSNIVLIGAMGSGKTTLGRVVSGLGGYAFVDTDEQIVSRYKCSIPHIFEQYGESYFRTLESEAAEEAAQSKNTVIATGGGLVTVARNMEVLRRTGRVFYLRCTGDELYARTCRDTNRPLLNAAPGEMDEAHAAHERLLRIRRLLAEREPLYLQYCDEVLDTDKTGIDALAAEIWRLARGRRGDDC